MATTITHNATTITPELVLGWESSQESKNILHDIIGKVSPDVTLKAPSLRNGTLTTFWLDETDAEACRALHSNLGSFTLASDEITQANMTYVTAGTIAMMLDEDTRAYWTVEIEFQEVDV